MPLTERVLHRVFRNGHAGPWWFSSLGADPMASGRFDLPPPDGTCYLATSAVGALLEAFQDFGQGILPIEELQRRRRAEVIAPSSAPKAATLVAAQARRFGVTQALWAGGERALTQRWARALRRAGWLALWSGLQHDTTGRLRGATLFDDAGDHFPYGDSSWAWAERTLADDASTIKGLRRYGIVVIGAVDPPFTSLADAEQ